jgi:ABC-type molybdate transport system substrate-binding protein
VLSFTENRAPAENFVQFLASDAGQAIFAKHNYRTEPVD